MANYGFEMRSNLTHKGATWHKEGGIDYMKLCCTALPTLSTPLSSRAHSYTAAVLPSGSWLWVAETYGLWQGLGGSVAPAHKGLTTPVLKD